MVEAEGVGGDDREKDWIMDWKINAQQEPAIFLLFSYLTENPLEGVATPMEHLQ